jgi:hypothetical protein
MKCQDCGCSNTKENEVYKAPDPFAEEIYGDDTEVWMCKNCREDRRDEI